MFAKLSPLWQEAFALAWEAFCRGNVPVGCVVADQDQRIVARGQNAIFDEPTVTPLAGTSLAHAEIVALSRLSKNGHNMADYTLYTTLEPCPMCLGAMAMAEIRQVRFAARDGWAGSAALAQATPYLAGKKINLFWEGSSLELFQLALSTAFELRRNHPRKEVLLRSWSAHCPEGVLVGKHLYKEGFFAAAREQGLKVEQVYGAVLENYARKAWVEEE